MALAQKLGQTALAFALVLVLAPQAQAGLVTFDFESQTTGNFTLLSITEDSLTMTIRRGGGSTFGIVDLAAFAPASWGNRTLQNFNNIFGGPFVVNFSMPLVGFSFRFSDAAPSDLDTVSITAFGGANGMGPIIDTASLMCCDIIGLPNDFGLSVAGSGIRSLVISGGSGAFPQSMYFDNFVAETVPEPASLALLSMGLAGIGMRLRRRNR